MANLTLTLACWDYDRTRPLMDGRVKPDGIDLDIKVLRPRQSFQRMLDNEEFQVSELSLASYAALVARGNCPFVAIPVAMSKIFRHSCIYVRTNAGITKPEDLRGRRVGTGQWGSTGLCFMRGFLQHDYGVKAEDMHWFMGGLTGTPDKQLIPMSLPSAIKLEYLKQGQALEDMLAAGELDALLSLFIPSMFINGSPQIARLFPNFKAIAVDGLYDTDALRVALPWLIDHVEENWRVFGKDFWAYGVEPNRPTWEAIGRFVHEQGLAPRAVTPEELFPVKVE